MPPSDALLQALAQASAQPDRWSRAVTTGAQAGQNILGGFMQGKQIQQQLEQYKLLNTPLGSMYPDSSQIPFGLGPQHTVKDLLTIAPAMENFAPANLMSGVASQYGANVTPSGGGGGVGAPSAPAPTIASTSMAPIAGAEKLNTVEGTGASAPSSPSLNIPAGGMGMGAFQKVVIPALNAAREGRQFQQGQASENARFATGQANENARFGIAQGNEKNRAVAGQQDEFTKATNRTMAGFDALKQLTSLYDKIPPQQRGAYVGQVTKFGGPMAGAASPELATYNQARHAFIGNFAAALDPMGRQNQALLAQVESMTPKVEDDARVVANKVSAMHQFLQSTVDRNYEGFNSAANTIGGNIQRPQIPPNTYFESEADIPPNLPVGTVIHVAGRRAIVKPNQ